MLLAVLALIAIMMLPMPERPPIACWPRPPIAVA
jgi:hypothetical protein